MRGGGCGGSRRKATYIKVQHQEVKTGVHNRPKSPKKESAVGFKSVYGSEIYTKARKK